MKTALVFGGVVAAVALVVTLALSMLGPVLAIHLGPVLDRYAESWVIGAVFNSWLLFWGLVLFAGLVVASVSIVALRHYNLLNWTARDESIS